MGMKKLGGKDINMDSYRQLTGYEHMIEIKDRQSVERKIKACLREFHDLHYHNMTSHRSNIKKYATKIMNIIEMGE